MCSHPDRLGQAYYQHWSILGKLLCDITPLLVNPFLEAKSDTSQRCYRPSVMRGSSTAAEWKEGLTFLFLLIKQKVSLPLLAEKHKLVK